MDLPALNIRIAPGRTAELLELAAEADSRGFAGLYTGSDTTALPFVQSMAAVSRRAAIGTTVQVIAMQHPAALAAAATHLAVVSGGRFRLGLGVGHGPLLAPLGLPAGRPLADMRRYVGRLRDRAGDALPPIVLAALRDRMIALAGEVADGLVFANASRSGVAAALARVLPDRAAGFWVGAMIPTVVTADRPAALDLLRRTLTFYVRLPNYRNAWAAAGYAEEMAALADAVSAGADEAALRSLMTERWLDDVAISGTAEQVRDGVLAWRRAGVTEPILKPLTPDGDEIAATRDVFAAFA